MMQVTETCVLLLKPLSKLALCCHSSEGRIPELPISGQPVPQQPTLKVVPQDQSSRHRPSEPGLP